VNLTIFTIHEVYILSQDLPIFFVYRLSAGRVDHQLVELISRRWLCGGYQLLEMIIS